MSVLAHYIGLALIVSFTARKFDWGHVPFGYTRQMEPRIELCWAWQVQLSTVYSLLLNVTGSGS